MAENQVVVNQKVRLWEKISFSLGGIGSVAAQTIMSTFLLIFYTDVCGLNPGAVATLFLITKLLDAVNDPIMGFVIDHLPRTRLGRFRTVFMIGSVVFALNFALVWIGPLWATGGKLIIAYISYILIGITFDFMDIPLNSLMIAMTSDTKQRSILATFKSISFTIGGALAALVVPIVLGMFATRAQGYTWVIVGIFLIILIFNTNAGINTRERAVVSSKAGKYRLKSLFRIFTIGPVVAFFFTQLLNTIYQMMLTSTMTYYATYILNNFQMIALYSAIAGVGIIPGMLISGKLGIRFGKKRIFCVGLLLSAVAYALRLVDPTNLIWLYLCSGVAGFGTGMVMPMGSVIGADNIEIIEYRTGLRAEGAASSLSTSLVKIGGAIAAAIPGYILAFTGYNSTLASTTTDYVPVSTALQGIKFMTLILPSIIALIAFVVMLFGYRLTNEKHDQMVVELIERNKADNGE